MPTDTEIHFWSLVRIGDPFGCWIWLGSRHSAGYGVFRVNGRYERAHRIAYEIVIGPIPAGKVSDHLCRTRECVNPFHLEPVENKTNVLRGIGPTAMRARATHCPKGHELIGANLYMTPSGYRNCRMCRADSDKRWKRKQAVLAVPQESQS